jgi:regulator of nucleoside diphosphate kinase
MMIHLDTAKDVVGYEGRYAMALYTLGGGGNPPRRGLAQNQFYVGQILPKGLFHVFKPDRMCYLTEFVSYQLASKSWPELSGSERTLLITAYNEKKVALLSTLTDLSLEARNDVAKTLNLAGYICWTDEEQTIELTSLGEFEIHNRIFNIDAGNGLEGTDYGIRIRHHNEHDHEVELSQSSTLSVNLEGIMIQIRALSGNGAIIQIDHDSPHYIRFDRTDSERGFAQVYINKRSSISNKQVENIRDTHMIHKDIYLTTVDVERLQKLFSDPDLKQQRLYLDKLKDEIKRAIIVDPSKILADVVTMNSRVCLVDVDTNEEMIVTLVYPEYANRLEAKISILAPIGTAILGYSEGDVVQWEVPDGTRNLRIDNILYQPEAAGVFNL